MAHRLNTYRCCVLLALMLAVLNPLLCLLHCAVQDGWQASRPFATVLCRAMPTDDAARDGASLRAGTPTSSLPLPIYPAIFLALPAAFTCAARRWRWPVSGGMLHGRRPVPPTPPPRTGVCWRSGWR